MEKPKKQPLVRWPLMFPENDLLRMERIEEETGINGQQYMRALLRSFLDHYDKNGHLSLPLCVLTKKQMEELQQKFGYEP